MAIWLSRGICATAELLVLLEKDVFIMLWYDIDGMGRSATQELLWSAEDQNPTATSFLRNTTYRSVTEPLRISAELEPRTLNWPLKTGKVNARPLRTTCLVFCRISLSDYLKTFNISAVKWRVILYAATVCRLGSQRSPSLSSWIWVGDPGTVKVRERKDRKGKEREGGKMEKRGGSRRGKRRRFHTGTSFSHF